MTTTPPASQRLLDIADDPDFDLEKVADLLDVDVDALPKNPKAVRALLRAYAVEFRRLERRRDLRLEQRDKRRTAGDRALARRRRAAKTARQTRKRNRKGNR